MFHTFQSSAGLRSPGADTDSSGKPSRPPGSRRISTSNACVECRRRKIRCDGTQPCGQCQWYQHPEVRAARDDRYLRGLAELTPFIGVRLFETSPESRAQQKVSILEDKLDGIDA